MITSLFKLISILNSEASPAQISIAAGLSMVAGLTPFFSLHNVIVLFLVLVLRVNISAFLLGLAFFSALAYLLDPVFHIIGLKVLTLGPLKGFWTELYNVTLLRLTRFNNSVLMGSLVFSLAAFAPFVLALNHVIRKYREHIVQWVLRTPIMKVIKASKLYGYYTSYQKYRSAL